MLPTLTILETHIVPDNVSGIRLSDYAAGIFTIIPTRKGIKKAIKKGAVYIDGELATTGRWVASGQVIQLIELVQKPSKVYQLDLEVIFEDNEIALINKPPGIVVSGNQFRTIQNALLNNLYISTAIDAFPCPLPVHRLDYSTSGLLLIAKTHSARRFLGKAFELRQIQKEYQAVVIGQTPDQGVMEEPIKQKKSQTTFKTLKTVPSLKNGHLSLVRLIPLTGRMHQLRIHLSEAGFPILGDKLYGRPGMILKGKGLFLCAVGLQFTHPKTREQLKFRIPNPAKFQTFMDREQKRWERYD